MTRDAHGQILVGQEVRRAVTIEVGQELRRSVTAGVARLLRAFARRGVLSSSFEDLTVLQWKAMTAINSAGSINTRAIARLLGVSMPSMSRVVSRLVEKGLVRRVPDPVDRRYIWLEPTQRFRTEIWPRTQARDLSFAEGIVDVLSPGQIAVLAKILPTLADAAELQLKESAFLGRVSLQIV